MKDYVEEMKKIIDEHKELSNADSEKLKEELTRIKKTLAASRKKSKQAYNNLKERQYEYIIRLLKNLKDEMRNFPVITEKDSKMFKKDKMTHFVDRLMEVCTTYMNIIDKAIEFEEMRSKKK